jgi:hypothetical protein
MELKVLISVLQNGNVLQNMASQVNQVSTALSKLQTQANAGAGAGAGAATTQAASSAGVLNRILQQLSGTQQTVGNSAQQASKGVLTLEDAMNKAWTAAKFLAGGFLALQSVRFLRDLGEVAARTETMGTVMHIVARNAGYTTEQIDTVDKSIQRLGITATSSRQALTQMLQAGLDIKFAERLARASQDLAVLSGLDSSQTLQKMVTNIQQLDTLGLRWMGIVVNRTEAEREYARTINKTADALSQRQRTEALAEGVLKKSAELAGAYEAAMGDVGKQMSSLTRYILEAKDAWGTALLPTMRVLVTEFTLFLQHMTTLGKEFSADRSLAEGFADGIRVVARAFRLVAETLVEHYNLIITVVKAWASWKVVSLLAPLAAFARWAYEMGPLLVAYVYATDAAAAANLRFAASLALIQNMAIVYMLIVLANSIVLLAEAMERANTAWEQGKFWQFISAKDTRSLGERFEEGLSPITGAAAQATMRALSRQMALPGQEAQSRRWEPTAPTMDPTYAAMPDAIAQRRKALNAATDAVRAAEERYAEAMRTGSQAELDASKKALDDAKEVRKAENLLFDEILARKEIDPKRREAELLFQRRRKEFNELQQLSKDVAAAEEGLFQKVQISPEGKVTSAPLERQLNNVRTQLDVYDRRIKGIGDMMASSRRDGAEVSKNMSEFLQGNANIIVRVRENLKLFVGPAAELPSDLEGFLQVLARFRKASSDPKDIALVRNLEGLARLQIRAKSQGQFAQLRQEQARITKDEQTTLTQAADFELELQQKTNERAQALDDERYAKGLMSLDEYYAGRLRRSMDQNALEVQAQQAKITAIKAETATTLPQDLPALANRLRDAENRLELIRKSGESDAQKLSLEYGNARIDLEREILDLRLKTAASYGSESAALQQIVEQYKRLQEQLKAVATAEGKDVDPAARDALRLAETQALLKTQEEYRQKRYEADLEHEEATIRQLDLEKQRRDLARQEITLREANSEISGRDAMRQRNALLEQDITGVKDRIASRQITLARQQEELRTAPERRRSELEKAGLNTPAEIEQQVQSMTDSIRAGVQRTQGEIESLTASVGQMMESMEGYGKQLKKQFEENFASALTQTIVDFHKAGDAWKSAAQSITNDIVNIFVTAFTQKLFKRLGVYRMADALANWMLGGGSSTALVGTRGGDAGGLLPAAEGGLVSGPGTGTSDSIFARVSTGEHIMPAAKTAQWLPVLEGIRTGRILPFATGGVVQSIAMSPIIPRRYAAGGVVVADGGASAVQTGGGPGQMIVTMHPDTLNMTMRDWLEHEVVRQQGRR